MTKSEITTASRHASETAAVSLPYTARGRMIAWARQRFQLGNRRVFWCTVTFISTCMILGSGTILQLLFQTPLYFMLLIPGLREPVESLMRTPAYETFNRYVEGLVNTSPVDYAIQHVIKSFEVLFTMPHAEDHLSLVGVLAVVIWVLIIARMASGSAQLVLASHGLRLIWKFPFFSIKGPLVPWSDVTGVGLKRFGNNSPDGRIDISYANKRWQYQLGQAVNEVGVNKFSLDLRNLDTLEQRQSLGKAIEQWAPPNTVQPDALDILSATQAQAYTELWLQALTAPSKRQSLEPLPEGKKLQNGKYEIAGQLGVGGQGIAYIAKAHEEAADAGHIIKLDGADTVVKEFVLPLYVDSNSRKDALKKFLDEADLLKRLDHERVVKLSDCFVEDHRGYIVLERIHGHNLREIVLKSGPMTESRVLELLDQMIDVLSYLHEQSPPVVHRDFAPDNLILRQDGVLKLVDFNVAQQTENSVTGTIVGKQSYVPPEQLRGMATPASDIYALGASLYFLLTGKDPEPLSVSHPIDIVPHLSKQTDELVARCTRLVETDRFRSVQEIREFVDKSITWHQER